MDAGVQIPHSKALIWMLKGALPQLLKGLSADIWRRAAALHVNGGIYPCVCIRWADTIKKHDGDLHLWTCSMHR